MASSKNDSPSTPRRRWRRLLIGIAVPFVLIAGLVIGFLPAFISSRLAGWIASSIRADGGAAVEIDRSSFSWGGEQSIQGLRLKERQPDGTFETLLSVDRAAVKNGLLDIARGTPLTIEIDAPAFEVHRDASGSINWVRLLDVGDPDDRKPESPEREHEPPDGGEPTDAAPLSWNVDRELVVTIRNARVRYQDDVLSTTSELVSDAASLEVGHEAAKAEISGRVVQPGAADAAPGELRLSGAVTGLAATFQAGDVSVKAEGVITALDLRPYARLLAEQGLMAPTEPVDGRITIETRDGKLRSELDLDAGFLSLLRSRLPEGLELGENAHASISDLVMDAGLQKGRGIVELTGRLRYQGFSTSRIKAAVEISDRRLLFRNVDADLNGGRLIAPRLGLDLTGEKPGYDLEIGLEDVESNYDMSPLLAYVVPFLSLEDRQGTLSGRITAFLKVQGRGLEVADLETLEGRGEFRLRDGQFKGSRFFREVARLAGGDLDRVTFSELGSDFRISGGAVASDNVFLTQTNDKLRNLGLKGTTTLRGEIDYGVDLAALQETVGDQGIREVLKGISDVLGDDGVPIRLVGTLTAPRLTWKAGPKQDGKAGGGVGGLLDRIFRQ